MEELINKLRGIEKLSELENISNINTNILLQSIIESGRYNLLENYNLRLNINDSESFENLLEYLIYDEDRTYYLLKSGYSFSKEELSKMLDLVVKKYKYSYKFDDFLRYFFANKEELNVFIKDNESFFKKYIKESKDKVSFVIEDCDNFVDLLLSGDNPKLIHRIESYSVSNLETSSTKITPKANISTF